MLQKHTCNIYNMRIFGICVACRGWLSSQEHAFIEHDKCSVAIEHIIDISLYFCVKSWYNLCWKTFDFFQNLSMMPVLCTLHDMTSMWTGRLHILVSFYYFMTISGYGWHDIHWVILKKDYEHIHTFM